MHETDRRGQRGRLSKPSYLGGVALRFLSRAEERDVQRDKRERRGGKNSIDRSLSAARMFIQRSPHTPRQNNGKAFPVNPLKPASWGDRKVQLPVGLAGFGSLCFFGMWLSSFPPIRCRQTHTAQPSASAGCVLCHR